MQKNCMIDSDVSIMMSPSKLAAQRIYSPKRNTITFHAALQSKSPDLAIASFERIAAVKQDVQDQFTKQEVGLNSWQESCVKPARDDSVLQKVLQNNDQQFKVIQEQIDLLRKVVANFTLPQSSENVMIASKNIAPFVETVQQPVLVEKGLEKVGLPENNIVTKTPTQPAVGCCATRSEESKFHQWLQKIFFAVVFLVGLVRIITLFVRAIEHFFSSGVKKSTSSSLSSSSSSSSSFSRSK